MKKLLVKNIGLLATPEGKSAHRGEEQGKIKFLKDAWVLIEDGIIASVGTGAVPAVEGAEVVDAGGHLVTPGLVDAHTHLIFGGWRQNELGLKLHGASYLDIQNAGGGIQSTTNATRQASEQELAAKASKALDEMMGFGTTTVEAKSGYGLATEHELKALEVIKDLNDHHRMDLVATFMGAHLVPAEYKSNREEYVRLVCEEMMPKVKEQGIAKFCDVFCEADTFTVEESRQVLEAGLKYGLRPKIHADEIEAIFAKGLAAEPLTEEEVLKYKTAFMQFVAGEYVRLGWAMQLHFGCKRDNNRAMFAKLGPDTGYDCISNYTPSDQLADFLNSIQETCGLPKTILYSLNPIDNTMIDTVMGCFQEAPIAGKIQNGSAWWFNDNEVGMREQLTALANEGVLGNFVGMLTDSRSFLSYPRHEYFRRVLCSVIGEWVEQGKYPADMELLGDIVRDISYNNAVRYFGFDLDTVEA